MLHELKAAGYAFLEGVFPYSQGVRALPGFAIERARFSCPVPLRQGFRLIELHLKSLNRPRTALCAAELRSPKPFSFGGFAEFNRGYVAVLEDWGIYRDGLNPVARSNVAPELDPPKEPCFYAFCYTVPGGAGKDFVVAGSGEWPEGGRFPEDIVARGDTSAEGLKKKAARVMETMSARLRGLNARWDDASAVQVYTVHPFSFPMKGNLALTWHYCRPPIEGLDYEMDLRAVSVERIVG